MKPRHILLNCAAIIIVAVGFFVMGDLHGSAQLEPTTVALTTRLEQANTAIETCNTTLLRYVQTHTAEQATASMQTCADALARYAAQAPTKQ